MNNTQGHLFVLDEADIEIVTQQIHLLNQILWEVLLRRKLALKRQKGRTPPVVTKPPKRRRLPIEEYF
jgi:hypothetical protein